MTKSMNIYQRINKVMIDITDVRKSDKKVNGQFSYISFNQVYKDVKPLFIKYGIVNTITATNYVQDGNMGTLTAMVEFINIDDPTDRISGEWVGQGISGNRNGSADDKSIGKALSYLHKNSICKLLLLGGSEKEEVDNDAKAVQTRKPKPKPSGGFPQAATTTPAANPFGQAPQATNPFANQGNNPQ